MQDPDPLADAAGSVGADYLELADAPPVDGVTPTLAWLKSRGFGWILLFCLSGVGVALCYEDLRLSLQDELDDRGHFFTYTLGFWSWFLFGCAFWRWFPRADRAKVSPVAGSERETHVVWHRRILLGCCTARELGLLLLGSVLDGVQRFGAVILRHSSSGLFVFVLLHNSLIVFFATAAAVVLLHKRLACEQWAGVLLVIAGLCVSTVPSVHIVSTVVVVPLQIGIALLDGCNYALCELVLRPRGSRTNAMDASTACTLAAVPGTVGFTVWACVALFPYWGADADGVMLRCRNHSHNATSSLLYPHPSPSRAFHDASKCSLARIALSFGMHTAMVGLHVVAYWHAIDACGTVSVAVSKGAQQAAVFLIGSLVFCRVDGPMYRSANHRHYNASDRPADRPLL